MNSEKFVDALNALVQERGIDPEYIYESLELALQTAYKKNFDSKTNVRVEINRENGIVKVFSYLIVVDDYDDGEESVDEEGEFIIIPPAINKDAQILLEDAYEFKADAQIGDEIELEVTPDDFGRVAAGTAKQVMVQKIREIEKAMIIEEFRDKCDELLVGMVAMEDARNFYIDLGKVRGILSKNELIPGEEIEIGMNIKVYVTKIEDNPKGSLVFVSRKHYNFVKRLFEHEIPEMVSGDIVVGMCVREPGVRSKLAVYSTNPKIDAIGSCIGQKGCRIASILKELGKERVDLILYSENDEEYIKNALAPAKDVIVNITDAETREALVIVNSDNLSLAIGKRGSNIKLASKLTRYRLNIKTLEELNKVGNED
ncbi:MAG: transcription termination factor NusA [bacterium]